MKEHRPLRLKISFVAAPLAAILKDHMVPQVILISITLASTIIGTCFNPNRWTKVWIVTLALATSASTVAIGYSDQRDKEFIKAALAAQLATNKPPPDFTRALHAGVQSIAQKHGVIGSMGAAMMPDGTLFFFTASNTRSTMGIVYFSSEELGDALIEYLSKRPFDRKLESLMFKASAPRTRKEIQSMLEHLGLIGKAAINQNVAWVGKDTPITQSYDANACTVTVFAEQRGNRIAATLSKDILQKIASEEPIKRDLAAYQEFQKRFQAANF